MIQIFTLPLAANEVREVSVSGEYFELRNALFPIALIELLDRNGAILARLENPEQSDFVRPGPFGTVRITNGAAAQTVKHFYGTGDAGSRRTSGLVRIDGASDVAVIDRVLATTQHILNSVGVAIGTVITPLLLPAANPNGLVIKGIYGRAGANAGAETVSYLFASPNAPVDQSSGANRVLLGLIDAIGGVAAAVDLYREGKLSRSIPAGWGFYAVDLAITAAGARLWAIEVDTL